MKLINKIIKEIEEFPTLPTIYTTLSDVMANPRSTAQDVANVISQDQSAASKILKTANSSLYGFRGRITTISQAVVYIGFEEIKNLVLAISILDMFNISSKMVAFNPVDLWKHSIAVGIISRQIAKEIGAKNVEQYFLSGILHDIGKLLFMKSIPELYSKVISYSIENNMPSKDVEKQVIGMSHTLAGKLLAERWKLPKNIIDCISNQYTGLVDGRTDSLVASVHIANVAATLLELGKAGDEIIPQINPQIWDELKLSSNFFTKSIHAIVKEYQDSVNLLLVSK